MGSGRSHCELFRRDPGIFLETPSTLADGPALRNLPHVHLLAQSIAVRRGSQPRAGGCDFVFTSASRNSPHTFLVSSSSLAAALGGASLKGMNHETRS